MADCKIMGITLELGRIIYIFKYSFYSNNWYSKSKNTVIEVDISAIFQIEYDSVQSLKKLVRLLCESHPYTQNIKELLGKMEMKDNYKGLYRFLEYLSRTKILTKPDKIYLNNTNLHFAYCSSSNVGTLREVFVASMFQNRHSIEVAKRGDVLVDDKYILEVGGNKIPLWLFGFLY